MKTHRSQGILCFCVLLNLLPNTPPFNVNNKSQINFYCICFGCSGSFPILSPPPLYLTFCSVKCCHSIFIFRENLGCERMERFDTRCVNSFCEKLWTTESLVTLSNILHFRISQNYLLGKSCKKCTRATQAHYIYR